MWINNTVIMKSRGRGYISSRSLKSVGSHSLASGPSLCAMWRMWSHAISIDCEIKFICMHLKKLKSM